MGEKITIVFENRRNNMINDIEIPLDITLRELIGSLNKAYDLVLDVGNLKEDKMVIENPICRIELDETLENLGFRQGTTLILKA